MLPTLQRGNLIRAKYAERKVREPRTSADLSAAKRRNDLHRVALMPGARPTPRLMQEHDGDRLPAFDVCGPNRPKRLPGFEWSKTFADLRSAILPRDPALATGFLDAAMQRYLHGRSNCAPCRATGARADFDRDYCPADWSDLNSPSGATSTDYFHSPACWRWYTCRQFSNLRLRLNAGIAFGNAPLSDSGIPLGFGGLDGGRWYRGGIWRKLGRKDRVPLPQPRMTSVNGAASGPSASYSVESQEYRPRPTRRMCGREANRGGGSEAHIG
jgi:hypothetical protein